jgi:hypothetical protein
MNQETGFAAFQFAWNTASISLNLAMVVMLSTSWILRRSLGAGPAWFATFIYAVSVECLWSLEGMPADCVLGTFANMMVLPTAIMLLARRQCIPGLRRGQLTPEQRRAFVLRRAFTAPTDLPPLLAAPVHRQVHRWR